MLDSYNNYYSYEFECYCKENDIVIFYILLHSFYLFQLFDVGCFNILKRLYSKEVENFIRSYINYIIKPDFFACFYIIFFTIFGKENIRIGFRDTNLVPFNLEAMIFKLDIKLYTLTSIRSFSVEVNSWVFKIL